MGLIYGEQSPSRYTAPSGHTPTHPHHECDPCPSSPDARTVSGVFPSLPSRITQEELQDILQESRSHGAEYEPRQFSFQFEDDVALELATDARSAGHTLPAFRPATPDEVLRARPKGLVPRPGTGTPPPLPQSQRRPSLPAFGQKSPKGSPFVKVVIPSTNKGVPQSR